MIECIFTIDYELYGDSGGSLRQHVYEPTQKLTGIFQKRNAPFVAFVEVAEFEKIEQRKSDKAIDDVRRQIQEMHRHGFEIGLHLHPQWYNAQYRDGGWVLDHSEYNLCKLSRERITQIIERSVAYLRDVLGIPDFTPVSFRAGNWLFQPTATVAAVLVEKGFKVDSSVFKGGLQHNHGLDYRRALKNGYYWRFQNDVNTPDPRGALVEIPTHTKMVPWRRMLTAKRVAMPLKNYMGGIQSGRQKLNRLRDVLRLRYPLKFDFCRMTIDELTSRIDGIIREDEKSPESFKPIVSIGHTKDLVDFETIEHFLCYLEQKRIPVSRLDSVLQKVLSQ